VRFLLVQCHLFISAPFFTIKIYNSEPSRDISVTYRGQNHKKQGEAPHKDDLYVGVTGRAYPLDGIFHLAIYILRRQLDRKKEKLEDPSCRLIY